MELTIDQALQQGVLAHKAGRLQDAERLYRAILQSQPTHPDANHNLGVLAVSVNKVSTALPLFRTAVEANPKIEQFWLSYIDALIKEKQFGEAKQVVEEAKNQGVTEKKLNILNVQLASIFEPKNINQRAPSQKQLRHLLELYQNKRFSEAEKLAEAIIEQFPEHQFAWKVMSSVLNQIGRENESLTFIQKSIELEPEDAGARYNLGNTLLKLGRLEEAKASYTQAIKLDATFFEAHNNLGNTLKELGRLEEAKASYTQAI